MRNTKGNNLLNILSNQQYQSPPMPMMGNSKPMMANGPGQPGMGGQTAGEAAEAVRYYPTWQQEFINGTTTLQFQDWLQEMYRRQQQQYQPIS